MKEVYETTLQEFQTDVLNGDRDFKLLGSNTGNASSIVKFLLAACRQGDNIGVVYDRFRKATEQEHEAVVLDAYAQGLPVPENVIAEYAHCLAESELSE